MSLEFLARVAAAFVGIQVLRPLVVADVLTHPVVNSAHQVRCRCRAEAKLQFLNRSAVDALLTSLICHVSLDDRGDIE